MHRRQFIKAGATLPLLSGLPHAVAQEVPTHSWYGYDFGSGPTASDRLNQGPFGIEQDEGWYTVLVTSQSSKPIRNYGFGLVGYTWEEGGPSLAVRAGTETLEQHVEKMASLPFVDVLYIRCDWRNVQTSPGKLDLHPVFKLTLDAAKRHNLRVAFRVQMSNTEFQPQQLALPDFLQKQVPLVKIGRTYGAHADFVEPRYDHPRFQSAFKELNELLAREFDNNPLMEFIDLMMYGFWGEGHTSNLPNPFPDYLTAALLNKGVVLFFLEFVLAGKPFAFILLGKGCFFVERNRLVRLHLGQFVREGLNSRRYGGQFGLSRLCLVSKCFISVDEFLNTGLLVVKGTCVDPCNLCRRYGRGHLANNIHAES